MIYYGLLPPLIFEAGFTMRKRKFFANFGTIFLYAVFGTLIAIVATGTLLWALNLDGSIDPNLNVNHFMLFGALISSTDPIATLGILKSAGANPLLYDLIFGESALNDCIAIVVFHIFHDLACAYRRPPPRWRRRLRRAAAAVGRRDGGGDRPHVRSFGRDHARLCVLLGMVAGLGSAWITKRLNPHKRTAAGRTGGACAAGRADAGTVGTADSAATTPMAPPAAPEKPKRREPPPRPHAELSLVFIIAFISYAVSDNLGMSGILSLFFCGITMRHYTWHNLSPAAQGVSRILFRALACLCDAALSLLLGIAFVDYVVEPFEPTADPSLKIWNFALIGTAAWVVLVTRLLNIVPMSELANCAFRKKKDRITLRMQGVMWFSGLRGSISFALAMTLDSVMEKQIDSSVGKPIVTTTLAIILMTNMAMAPLTGPLIRWLRLGAADGARGDTAFSRFTMSGAGLASSLLPPLRTSDDSSAIPPAAAAVAVRRTVAGPSAVGTRDGTLASCMTSDSQTTQLGDDEWMGSAGPSVSASVSVAGPAAAAARPRRRARRRASRRRWRARARRRDCARRR